MGAAPWQVFRFCPRCGVAREPASQGARPLRCEACGFLFFFNPAVAVAALIVRDDGKALFIRRATEPAKGRLARCGSGRPGLPVHARRGDPRPARARHRHIVSYLVGIDLGGTHVKAAAFAHDGAVLDRHTQPTRDGDRANGMPAWADTIRGLIETFASRLGAPADRVGLAAPGLPARDGRSILSMPLRMDGLEGLDWGRLLGRDDGVRVVNDAHAALLGEAWQGAARAGQTPCCSRWALAWAAPSSPTAVCCAARSAAQATLAISPSTSMDQPASWARQARSRN